MYGFSRLLPGVLLVAALAVRAPAAITVQATIDPQEVNVGDEATITYTVAGGSVEDFNLPAVDGLSVEGTSTSSRFVVNGFQVSQKLLAYLPRRAEPRRQHDYPRPSMYMTPAGGRSRMRRPSPCTSSAPALRRRSPRPPRPRLPAP